MNSSSPPSWPLAHGEALQVGLSFGLSALPAVAERVAPFRRTASGGKRRWPSSLALTLLNLLTPSALRIGWAGNGDRP